ncbi:MAG: hypothetical protein U0326_16600 [Polyangiales bacterium]
MVRRNEDLDRFDESKPVKGAKKIPFDFVLDELAAMAPTTRPMFGCTAVYVGERIVMILRKKSDDPYDSGVWLATTETHHASLRDELPSMRSIAVFGSKITGWQNLPEESDDFEESVLRACALVRSGDLRIGKVPAKKGEKKPTVKKPAAKEPAAKEPAAKKKPVAKKKPAAKKRSSR